MYPKPKSCSAQTQVMPPQILSHALQTPSQRQPSYSWLDPGGRAPANRQPEPGCCPRGRLPQRAGRGLLGLKGPLTGPTMELLGLTARTGGYQRDARRTGRFVSFLEGQQRAFHNGERLCVHCAVGRPRLVILLSFLESTATAEENSCYVLGTGHVVSLQTCHSDTKLSIHLHPIHQKP